MVEHIGKEAFQTSGLKSAAFSKSFREVGERAFSHCEQLWSVVFLEGVTEVRSDRFIKSRIESVTVSASVFAK